jgi:hypothetical protein
MAFRADVSVLRLFFSLGILVRLGRFFTHLLLPLLPGEF